VIFGALPSLEGKATEDLIEFQRRFDKVLRFRAAKGLENVGNVADA
jgi:hypothetical protein